MQIRPFDEPTYRNQLRTLDQLSAKFAEFVAAARGVREKPFEQQEIELEEASHGRSFKASFRWLEIEFFFSTFGVSGGRRGRITAVLSKHPTITEPPVIGTIDFNFDGLTNVEIRGAYLDVRSAGPLAVLAAIDHALNLDGPVGPRSGIL